MGSAAEIVASVAAVRLGSLVEVASESEENLLGGARDPLRARRGCALDGRVPGKKADQGLAWPRGVVWPVAQSRRSFQRHIVRRLISRIGLLSRNVGNLDQNRRITCLTKFTNLWEIWNHEMLISQTFNFWTFLG